MGISVSNAGYTMFRGSVNSTGYPLHLNRRGASVQSTTGSWGVRISGSNAGYTMLRGTVESTGYPIHSPVTPSLLLPCVTLCQHISTGLYSQWSHLLWRVSYRESFVRYIQIWAGKTQAVIVTCYGTDSPGIESRWVGEFLPQPSWPVPEPT